jgi:cytoskeleton-associated protein 5
VTDSNKAVQVLALDIVSRIATGMGKPFDKHARLLVTPICTVLSDQKANIRAAAVQTLNAIAEACEGVECMVPGVTTALESTNPLQKATLIQWAVDWFKGHEPQASLDLRSWAPLIVGSLDDRSSDIRKAAQALLPILIQCSSYDFVLQQTNSLKPASRSSAIPLIQAARPSESAAPAPKAAPVAKVAVSPVPSPPSPDPESPVTASVPDSKPAVAKGLGVRRKLPQSLSRPDSRAENTEPTNKPNAIKRPIPASTIPAKASTSSPTMNGSLPFSNMNLETKKSRLGKDVSRWVNEGGPTRKDLADALQAQMDPHTSKELVARLFSHDHNAVNDWINGLTTIADFYSGAIDADENIHKLCLANLDLPLKYISIKFHEPQPNLISKCLDVAEAILAFLRSVNYQLIDNEAMCFVPTVVFKVRTRSGVQSKAYIYGYSLVTHENKFE